MTESIAGRADVPIRQDRRPCKRHVIDFGDGNEFEISLREDGEVESFSGGYRMSGGDGFFIDGEQFGELFAWLATIVEMRGLTP